MEERHFRAAFSKHRGNLLAMHEAVRTKSLQAVVRFYYVEDGLRIKTERERKREIELLRLSRSQQHNKEGAANAAAGDSLSRASTPFDTAGEPLSALDEAMLAAEEGLSD